jgi:hypothetical protein
LGEINLRRLWLRRSHMSNGATRMTRQELRRKIRSQAETPYDDRLTLASRRRASACVGCRPSASWLR